MCNAGGRAADPVEWCDQFLANARVLLDIRAGLGGGYVGESLRKASR